MNDEDGAFRLFDLVLAFEETEMNVKGSLALRDSTSLADGLEECKVLALGFDDGFFDDWEDRAKEDEDKEGEVVGNEDDDDDDDNDDDGDDEDDSLVVDAVVAAADDVDGDDDADDSDNDVDTDEDVADSGSIVSLSGGINISTPCPFSSLRCRFLSRRFSILSRSACLTSSELQMGRISDLEYGSEHTKHCELPATAIAFSLNAWPHLASTTNGCLPLLGRSVTGQRNSGGGSEEE